MSFLPSPSKSDDQRSGGGACDDVPACATVKVEPAMSAAALRVAASVFWVSAKVTVPDPMRPVPSANARKSAWVVAVQAQPGCVATETVPVYAAGVLLMFIGLIE